MPELNSKKMPFSLPVGILGYGVEGQSTLQWLKQQGVANQDIYIIDRKPVQVEGIQSFNGDNYLDGLKDCTTVIRSAGVNPLIPELLRFQMHGGLLTSQIELFFEVTKAKRVVGVTGTLGKGSCISMIAHILDYLKIDHALGGNYGVAALDLLANDQPERVVLLELSSFQLMTLARSPQIAVVLRTTSEHLDWHRSVEEYRDAKANLVRWQKPTDFSISLRDAEGSRWIAEQGRGRRLSFGQDLQQGHLDACFSDQELRIGDQVLMIADCQIHGVHQLENMAAALLAVQCLGVSIENAMTALKSYKNLQYRLQHVGSHQNIDFYNDSYATRPEAATSAARSMSRPFSMILGGSEKHADFTELAQVLCSLSHLKGIALIGQTADRLRSALESQGFAQSLTSHETFESAFDCSVEQVQGGGAVLLSPACASFGLFENYKARGKRFDQLVQAFSQKS